MSYNNEELKRRLEVLEEKIAVGRTHNFCLLYFRIDRRDSSRGRPFFPLVAMVIIIIVGCSVAFFWIMEFLEE